MVRRISKCPVVEQGGSSTPQTARRALLPEASVKSTGLVDNVPQCGTWLRRWRWQDVYPGRRNRPPRSVVAPPSGWQVDPSEDKLRSCSRDCGGKKSAPLEPANFGCRNSAQATGRSRVRGRMVRGRAKAGLPGYQQASVNKTIASPRPEAIAPTEMESARWCISCKSGVRGVS